MRVGAYAIISGPGLQDCGCSKRHNRSPARLLISDRLHRKSKYVPESALGPYHTSRARIGLELTSQP
jgi:hypothetical protein